MVAYINNNKTEAIPRNVVTSIVNKLQKEGYCVKTNFKPHQNRSSNRIPTKYRSYAPNIFAFKEINKIVLIEFENSANILSSRNEQKWKILSSKPGLDFHIIVPHNCVEKAQIKSRIKNIPVKIHCINTWPDTLEFNRKLSK
ncbi:MAG: hypothetical protein HZC47_06595 [Methanobacterium sp.]|uniref:hypothetical protein n=1 Tax=Methanobacterium sp. TaxID=2164 RepID=UPI003D6500E4|nr:hypothetical protein [Methanobacterium sp.]